MTSRYEENMKSKPYLPFKMGYLTDAMVAKAEKELGETEDVKAKAIPELRKLVEAETKLSCPKDDAYLLQYLRARKFNVKKAFSLMQNYHQVKKSYSDVYDSYDPEALKRTFDLKAIVCLPYRDEDGCVIFVIKMHKWNPDVANMNEAVAALALTLLKCIEDPATQVCGVRVLVDVRGASLKQARCITPRFMALFAKALRNCIAVRFKSIHMYNESVIFQYIYSVLKLFLSEKIKNRVHFHGDNQKQLHKFIPKAILPAEEYGGDNPNDVSAWFVGEVTTFFEKYGELTTYGYKK